jgi:hypothetical protein
MWPLSASYLCHSRTISRLRFLSEQSSIKDRMEMDAEIDGKSCRRSYHDQCIRLLLYQYQREAQGDADI